MLEPDIPSEGVCADQDAHPCTLHVDHRRERSTGPCFPLTVMRCRPHRRAFTLYPPGHVPYGRVGLVAVAPDGSPIRTATAHERFAATLFGAAQEAATGQAWHREHEGSTERWWGTQLRRLAVAARLLAVAPAIDARQREQVADVLSVDVLVLHEQAQHFRSARGYRQRGAAVCRVLEALPGGRFLPERLVECGTLAACWGRASRWLPDIASLRRRPFRAPGTQRPHRPP